MRYLAIPFLGPAIISSLAADTISESNSADITLTISEQYWTEGELKITIAT